MENRISTLLFWFISIGVCAARRVSVSPGPLIRVAGQPIALHCEVADYEGPREQDFDWTVQKAGAGPLDLISTFDPTFSDESLKGRVASGDLSVARLTDSTVELRIKTVMSSDSAVYNCKTPSTDSAVRGNYEAQVQLTVIADTLTVAPEVPPPVVPEGSDITLACTVTRQLSHSTYLSVTWSLKKGSGPLEEILTFGPQGDVTTGGRYSQRYADGALRLAPGKAGAFRLVVAGASASADEGTYVCTGREWTHEDGGKWRSIVERSKDMGPVAVTPTAQSLTVSALADTKLNIDDTLTLTCAVAADNLPSLSLEVAWLVDGRTVAGLSRDGVASNGSSVVGLERAAPGEFRLVVRGVGVADAGTYSCRVRAWVRRGGAGGWYTAAEKTSGPVKVTVSQIEPSFTVTSVVRATPQATFDPTVIDCQVTNVSHLPAGGRLGVSWEYTPLPGPLGDRPATARTTQLIGSLDAKGNLSPGEMYKDRMESGAIAATRVQPDTFKLRFLRTQEVDMGQYVCVVSAWAPSRLGDMVRSTESRGPALEVRWEPKRPSLGVVAKRVREASVGGATFEMSCSVANENLAEPGYSVLIQSKEALDKTAKTVLSLSPDNVLQHGGGTDPSRRDNLVLSKTGPSEFRFRLSGVQLVDRGFYWCDVTAWTKQPGQAWTRTASNESNKVQILFQENGPSFDIAIHSDTTSVYPWETAKIECSLSVSGSSPKTDDLAYEVRWFQTRLRGGQSPVPLASVDRRGLVTKAARNGSSEVSLERVDAHTYALRVHATQSGDSGEYFCAASPWHLSAATGAWTQGAELTSPRVFLTVRFAVWESLKLPLFYGACASLGVGLFSLVLGLVCAHCCCRNTLHTPRSRNKLMDLEMD
ncbi:prostaglandin F2 receptor negative regulator [Aplochiton taeniatus]